MGKRRGPEKGGIRNKHSKFTQYRSTWGLTTSTRVSWPCWKSPETKQVTKPKSQFHSLAGSLICLKGGWSGKLQLMEGFYPLYSQTTIPVPHSINLVLHAFPAFRDLINLSYMPTSSAPESQKWKKKGKAYRGASSCSCF